MNRLDRSLKSRVVLAFAMLGTLCFVVAGIGMNGIRNADIRARQTYEQLTLPAQYIQSSYIATLVEVIQLMEAMALSDQVERRQRFDFIRNLQKSSDEQFALFERSDKADAIKPLADEIVRNHEKFSAAMSKDVQLFQAGNVQEAIAVETDEVRPYGVSLFQNVMKLSALLNSESRAAHERDAAAYQRMMTIMISILVVGALVTWAYVLVQIRSLGRGIGGIQKTLQDVNTSLDLTRRVPVERMDEIGRTAVAFNDLMDRIGQALAQVDVAADSVSTASRQISAGNLDLSARTEQQAASLEETAASMTELTVTVRQNADNARQANAVVVNATGLADASNRSVQEMVTTMTEISRGAGKISEIIGLIEGIAFQTNILALNAAVEAARAGEEGRGFAVVASEVRSLAQRSAAAAKEIKVLIEASLAQVESGSRQATEVGDTVAKVQQAIRQVFDLAGEITAASEEQSRGIEQVGQAVVQMDEVTQQNAALVEEAAAAAQALDAQAGNMKDAVSSFTFAHDASVAPSTTTLPRTPRADRTPAVVSRARAANAVVKAPRVVAPAGAGTPRSGSCAEADMANSSWEIF
ncbi:methyl-accepting chemotaxis protein [Burkholderia multivorans]